MIQFLWKGLIRDKSRSLIPTLVVSIGVALSVFMHAYIHGVMSDMIQQTAHFSHGHLKVSGKAYQELADQLPVDLSMLHASEIETTLNQRYPDVDWSHRVRFGAIVDVADSLGETKTQGPSMGLALDLLSSVSKEVNRLNLLNSLVQGKLPIEENEALLSDEFASKLQIRPGESFTLITSTMFGNMAYYNLKLAGTVQFGSKAMDKGSVIVDIEAARTIMDMENASSEILGFFDSGFYEKDRAERIKSDFAELGLFSEEEEYAPDMQTLRDDAMMGVYIDLSAKMGLIIHLMFLLAMSLVLWNAGLLGALRRYGEFGVRLAIGEEKPHLFRSLIIESAMIGFAGSVIGTILGLSFAFILQEYGLNIETFSQNASQAVMMPNVIRARISPIDFYIGFIPGVLSTVIGASLAGIGIYKRNTAVLFKEL